MLLEILLRYFTLAEHTNVSNKILCSYERAAKGKLSSNRIVENFATRVSPYNDSAASLSKISVARIRVEK